MSIAFVMRVRNAVFVIYAIYLVDVVRALNAVCLIGAIKAVCVISHDSSELSVHGKCFGYFTAVFR